MSVIVCAFNIDDAKLAADHIEAAEADNAGLRAMLRDEIMRAEAAEARAEKAEATAKSNGEMWAQADTLYKQAEQERLELSSAIGVMRNNAADLLESNREQAETITTLRASLAAERAAHETDVTTLRAERDDWKLNAQCAHIDHGAARQKLEQATEAAKKFSAAHSTGCHYCDNPSVDPQDWAEFDQAFGIEPKS